MHLPKTSAVGFTRERFVQGITRKRAETANGNFPCRCRQRPADQPQAEEDFKGNQRGARLSRNLKARHRKWIMARLPCSERSGSDQDRTRGGCSPARECPQAPALDADH